MHRKKFILLIGLVILLIATIASFSLTNRFGNKIITTKSDSAVNNKYAMAGYGSLLLQL